MDPCGEVVEALERSGVDFVRLSAVGADPRAKAAAVVAGGGLLIVADGPPGEEAAERLLQSLHLTVGEPMEGSPALTLPSNRVCSTPPPEPWDRPYPVGGVGWVILRADGETVALAAPRGAGRVVLLGSPGPLTSSPADFAQACIRWASPQKAPEPR